MAREVGIKVKIDGSGGKAGIKEIENETKRAAAGMRGALSGALSAGMKGGQDAAKKLIGDVRSAVGVVGGLLGGLGLAELVKGAVEANSKFSAMAAGIKFAGGSAKEAAAAQAQAQKSALAWGQDSMKVVDAFQAIRGETGSIEFAQASIDTVSEAARGAHKSLEGMSSVAGTLNEKFGITAEQLPDALADVVGLSEKGGLQFEDMAERLGVIGALAKEAGLSGREGFGQMLALMNVADNSTGNLKKGITAVGGLLEQLGTTAGKQKIGASLGLSQKDLGGNAAQQIEAIMRATKGQKSVLEKAFGGEQLKVLVDLGRTYSAAFDSTAGDVRTKSAAGAEALRTSLADAGKSTVTWADLQKSAAAAMAESPQKIATATERLRQAMQSEQMQAALGKIIDRLPALADVIAKIVGFVADSPMGAAGLAIGGTFAKGAVESAVPALLKAAFKEGGSGAAVQVAQALAKGGSGAAAEIGASLATKGATFSTGLAGSIASLGPYVAIFAAAVALFYAASEADAKREQEKRAAQAKDAERMIKGAAGGRTAGKFQIAGALEAATGIGFDPTADLTDAEIAAMSASQDERDKLELQRSQARAARGAPLDMLQGERLLAAGAIPRDAQGNPIGLSRTTSQVQPTGGLSTSAASAPAAPAGIDPATWATLAQMTGKNVGDAIGGKVLKVEVVGGNAPTGTGPVTPGSRPR